MIDPAEGAFAITPSDTENFDEDTRAIFVGVSGNLKVTMANGDTVTFTGVLGGMVYPLRVRKVWDDGTSAESLVGLY